MKPLKPSEVQKTGYYWIIGSRNIEDCVYIIFTGSTDKLMIWAEGRDIYLHNLEEDVRIYGPVIPPEKEADDII